MGGGGSPQATTPDASRPTLPDGSGSPLRRPCQSNTPTRVVHPACAQFKSSRRNDLLTHHCRSCAEVSEQPQAKRELRAFPWTLFLPLRNGRGASSHMHTQPPRPRGAARVPEPGAEGGMAPLSSKTGRSTLPVAPGWREGGRGHSQGSDARPPPSQPCLRPPPSPVSPEGSTPLSWRAEP